MTKELIKNIAITIHKQVNIDRVKAWLDIDFEENEAKWLKIAEEVLNVINDNGKKKL